MTIVWTGEIQWRDLPLRPRPGVQLVCSKCEQAHSACSLDYLLADPDATCRCGESGCDGYLRLAIVTTSYKTIEPAEAEEKGRP